MTQPTLLTDRLELRPFSQVDLLPFAKTIFACKNVMQTLPENDLVCDEDYLKTAKEYMETFTEPWDCFGWGGWAIALRDACLGDPGQLIGFCGFLKGKLSDVYPEIGYGIGQRWWGKGLTSEAAEACVEWIFGNTDIGKIWGVTYGDNIASQKIFRRLGMIHSENVDLYDSIQKGRGLMQYYYLTKRMYAQ